jgi:hypothetical protein
VGDHSARPRELSIDVVTEDGRVVFSGHAVDRVSACRLLEVAQSRAREVEPSRSLV